MGWVNFVEGAGRLGGCFGGIIVTAGGCSCIEYKQGSWRFIIAC